MSGYMTETEGFMDLVNRKCIELMRRGGGPLGNERPAWTGPRVRTTQAKIDEAIAMARTGEYTMVQVARALDLWPQTISRICERHKIATPSGYTGKRKAFRDMVRGERAA